MQCRAQHQAVRHHTESTDGAARHAGCSGPMIPCETAHRRRQGSVGQVRECTGPAMQQHTYTQRAHNTHSPARLPVPVGRHPGLCPLVTAPSAQHNTTQHNTTQHNTTQHNTTQHNTTQPEYSPALPTGWVPGAKPRMTGSGTANRRCTNRVGRAHVPEPSAIPRDPAAPSTGRLDPRNGQQPPVEDG